MDIFGRQRMTPVFHLVLAGFGLTGWIFGLSHILSCQGPEGSQPRSMATVEDLNLAKASPGRLWLQAQEARIRDGILLDSSTPARIAPSTVIPGGKAPTWPTRVAEEDQAEAPVPAPFLLSQTRRLTCKTNG